jgi:hypothetical protein
MSVFDEYPEEHPSNKERGLYGKFNVDRTDDTDGPGMKHEGCQYFVLDLDHDPLALPAIDAYVIAARLKGYHKLADDLDDQAHAMRIRFA